MERSNFFTDQDVLKEDLNNIESSKGNQLRYRAQYILGASGGVRQSNPLASASVERGGIYYNTAIEEGEEAEGPTSALYYKEFFNPSVLSATSIRILEGAALDPNGEVIINPATIDMTKGSTGANYDWSTAAPGEIQWYVKLRYAAASGSFKSDDLGTSYPTRYTDSFIINVDYTEPTADDILIASFQGTSGGNITGSIVDERAFVRVITPANAVILDPSTVPVAAHLTVEDHIDAVGSGVASDTNPHGLSPDDIGVSSTVEPHRKEAHTPGVIDITGEYIDSAAFRDSYLGTPADIGADVEISWTSGNANAAMIVKGERFTPTLVTLSMVNHPDMIAGGDTLYWLYFDNTTASVYNVRATPSNLDNYKTADKLLLCKIQRISGGSEFSGFEDLRRFYGTSQKHIGPDLDEGAVLHTLNRVSTLQHNLDRMRYQLGLSLTGVGSAWDGSNPLTAGATSIADAYHTHTDFPGAVLKINSNGIFQTPFYSMRKAAGEIAGMLHHGGNPSNNMKLYFVANYIGTGIPTTAMKATGSMAALEVDGYVEIGGNPINSAQAAAIPTLAAGPSSDADAYHTHDTHKQPNNINQISAYVFGKYRRNVGSASIVVFATGQYYSGQPTMRLEFYTGPGPDSASVVKCAEFQSFSELAFTTTIRSLTGYVPANWFYKFDALNMGPAGQYGTGSVTELYNDTVSNVVYEDPT